MSDNLVFGIKLKGSLEAVALLFAGFSHVGEPNPAQNGSWVTFDDLAQYLSGTGFVPCLGQGNTLGK
jgi:hypothetical protein